MTVGGISERKKRISDGGQQKKVGSKRFARTELKRIRKTRQRTYRGVRNCLGVWDALCIVPAVVVQCYL